MKAKFFGLAAAAMFAMAGTAFAQIPSGGALIVPISVVTNQNLGIGEVLRNTPFTVNIDGTFSGTASTLANPVAPGKFTVTGDAGAAVKFLAPPVVVLDVNPLQAGMDNTVDVNLQFFGNTTNNVAGAGNYTSNTAINLSSDASGNGINNDFLGQLFFWIKGNGSTALNQQMGSYNGSINVNVVYF